MLLIGNSHEYNVLQSNTTNTVLLHSTQQLCVKCNKAVFVVEHRFIDILMGFSRDIVTILFMQVDTALTVVTVAMNTAP